jgi:hypothetical protein
MTAENALVITSINELTKGVRQFLQFEGWDLIFVADKATPAIDATSYNNLDFFSVDDQEAFGGELASTLPYGHYGRKNLGYLKAFDEGYDRIAETDDDNIPKNDWDLWLSGDDLIRLVRGPKYPNVYREFTDADIWPRGYPLEEIRTDHDPEIERVDPSKLDIGVVNGLADRDPDVDAIHRLVVDELVWFDDREPIALSEGVYCPFNSQNTLWFPGTYAYMYLPTTVTYRFTDILRSFVTLRGFQAIDRQVAFTRPSVVQERNPHDLMVDFEAEIGCYTQGPEAVKTLEATDLKGDPQADLRAMYRSLYEADIVDRAELNRVNAWLADVAAFAG